MKEKRTRLNFKQKANGQIHFEGTVELINPVNDNNPDDLAEISKSASDKLAEEALSILTSAKQEFTDAGYIIVKSQEEKSKIIPNPKWDGSCISTQMDPTK